MSIFDIFKSKNKEEVKNTNNNTSQFDEKDLENKPPGQVYKILMNAGVDVYGKYYKRIQKIENTFMNRNLKGTELEKTGALAGAIRLYEQNVADEFDGSHPYNRLRIIYHKQKQYEKEIEILEKALKLFPSDEKLQKHLLQAKELIKKEK